MKNNMKKIITAFILLLIIAVFPASIRAEEQKPATPEQTPAVQQAAPTATPEQKPAEQKPEEDKVTGQIDFSALSAYIWRGQELSRHSVVVQPAVTASYKGLSLNVWGNLDTKPYSASGEQYSSNYNETDVTLSYSNKFGIVQVGAGYIYYALAAAVPGGTDLLDSQEIFVTLGLDTILAPTLTVYKEFSHYHQWYATMGVSHTFSLHEKVGLKLAAQASYLKSEDETTYPEFKSNLNPKIKHDSLATTDKFNNFHDGMISASLPIAITSHITVSPTLAYVFPLSDDAKYEMKARSLEGTANPPDKDSSFLYGGVTLSYAF